ncbi:urease accessory protein UreF [Bradyrhizobium elkanii]
MPIITTTTLMLMTTNEPDPAALRGGMAEDEAAALYRLMTWLSPSFPVGAFAYSSGIEWAVEAGDITDAASLRDWLAAMLSDGSGFCDAVFLAQSFRAALQPNHAGLKEIAELAAAFVPSRERRLETTTQGRAFIEIAGAAWNSPGLDAMIAACDGPIVYPVAVGLVSAAHGIRLAPALHAFLHAVLSNWIFRGQPADPARADRQPARAGRSRAGRCRDRGAGRRRLARRSRQRDLSRRSRKPASRDAVHEAVPVMMVSPSSRRRPGPITTGLCGYASLRPQLRATIQFSGNGSRPAPGRR